MRIAILGAGGHGRVVLDLLKAAGKYELAGFFDRQFYLGIPKKTFIIGSESDLIESWREFRVEGAVVAIGDNQIREKFFQQLVKAGLEMPELVHPSAMISPEARIGPGLLFAGIPLLAQEWPSE